MDGYSIPKNWSREILAEKCTKVRDTLLKKKKEKKRTSFYKSQILLTALCI